MSVVTQEQRFADTIEKALAFAGGEEFEKAYKYKVMQDLKNLKNSEYCKSDNARIAKVERVQYLVQSRLLQLHGMLYDVQALQRQAKQKARKEVE